MFKKILKGYLISILIFAILTLISAIVLKFSSITENSGIYLILIAMSISCLLFGVAAGNAVGKRGLFVGMGSAVLMLFTIVMVNILCFQAEPNLTLVKLIYLIPVLAGIIGGIIGANLLKNSNITI